MAPPRTTVHKCNKETEINNLNSKVNKLDEAINGNGEKGMKVQVATLALGMENLIEIVKPMAGNVTTLMTYMTQAQTREQTRKDNDQEDREMEKKKNRIANTWVNIIIAAVALGALAVSIMALKGTPL